MTYYHFNIPHITLTYDLNFIYPLNTHLSTLFNKFNTVPILPTYFRPFLPPRPFLPRPILRVRLLPFLPPKKRDL